MQGYTYIVDASMNANAATLGVASILSPVDSADPTGDQKAGPITPGSLANKVLATSPVPVVFTIDQPQNVLRADNAGGTAPVEFVPQAIPAFNAV